MLIKLWKNETKSICMDPESYIENHWKTHKHAFTKEFLKFDTNKIEQTRMFVHKHRYLRQIAHKHVFVWFLFHPTLRIGEQWKINENKISPSHPSGVQGDLLRVQEEDRIPALLVEEESLISV